MTSQSKPKLVFFQYRYDENLPEFLLIHKRDHVRCLSKFFDVTVIHDDSDYQEICDKHEPDLALFESGVNHTTCRRLKITNVRSCPQVPKLGLHNADAFCNARTGFLSDMDHWGIETFFAISTTAAEHTPEMADRLYVWPNCIDPETYRDYGAWKSIPVLFSGNTNALYPWRQQIVRLVSERYPSLICPHTGYDPGSSAAHVLFGEQYARMINASVMAPACGTVAKEVVRKHFEIPACKACLVTERSEALEAAGFVDMENCVFADQSDVLDKLQHLFQNPLELQRITERGYQLVHERHTFAQRDQIFQWYNLQDNLQPHQAIVQSNPFGPLVVVDKSSGARSAHVKGEGLHLRLLRKGDNLLKAGRYREAENAYAECMNYMRWMPEPKLGVALCRLHTGDAKAANSLISAQIEFILGGYGAIDPDPVEWAYYILSLLCLGKLETADRAAAEFLWLRHPELDRARRVVRLISGDQLDHVPSSDAKQRRTIHQRPATSWTEWIDQVCLMLRACGQEGFAEQLKQLTPKVKDTDLGAKPDTLQGPLDARRSSLKAAESAPGHYRRLFERRFRKRPVRLAIKRIVSRCLHRMESTCGYFLPYNISEMKRDELYSGLQKLAKEQVVKNAILIGVGSAAGRTEALLAGIAETGSKAQVFCVDGLSRQFRKFEKTFAGRVRAYAVPASSPAEFSQNLGDTIRKIRAEHHIDAWDAVVIEGLVMADRNVLGSSGLQHELRRARLVAFDGINNMGVHEHRDRLLNDPNYVLVANNPELRDGYAIFRMTTVTGHTAAGEILTSPQHSEKDPNTRAQCSTDARLMGNGPGHLLAESLVPAAVRD